MEERRKAPRHRALKAGKIIFNRQLSVMDCSVKNLSDDGACLVVTSPVGVPDAFELQIPSDSFNKTCRVVWRSSDKIGVMFI